MDLDALPRFVTVPRAARAIGVGRDAIRHAVATGQLRTVRLRPGGWPRIDVRELARWVAALDDSPIARERSPLRH